MRIVVVGGSGRVGAKLVDTLRHRGHDVMAASPRTGVNTITGEGLAEAMTGCNVVIDVTNSPSFEDNYVLKFFETSSRNLVAAAEAARVKHHVVLSIVGTDRLLESGYFRAKMRQEDLVRGSLIPHTVLRSTQFFEFMPTVLQSEKDERAVRVSPALVQPIESAEVAAARRSCDRGASQRHDRVRRPRVLPARRRRVSRDASQERFACSHCGSPSALFRREAERGHPDSG